MHRQDRNAPLWAAALLCLLGVTACAPHNGAASVASSPTSPASVTASTATTATTGTSGTTATTQPRGTTPRATKDQFTVVTTGDVLLHPALWDQARADAKGSSQRLDFAPMLAGVKPYVSSADLAICHLETPLATTSGPFSGYPDFSGPPQIATALKATGYDACSTASNHTLDQNSRGITRTLDTLDDAGLAHAGSARTKAESTQITMVTVRGVKIALLSYAYGFNGHTYPGGQTWLANQINPAKILDDAKLARRQGAHVVITALHWGTEYQQTPSKQQLELAPKLARSGVVDLIISHHSHVVEPIQRIGKVWVVYGLGNLIAWHSTPGQANQEGLLASFTFARASSTRWTVTKAGYLPLLVTRSAPIRLLSVPAALATKTYGSSSRARLVEALNRTTAVVTGFGATKQGLIRLH